MPYPSVPMLPQWRTEPILRDRLEELGGRGTVRKSLGVGLAGETYDTERMLTAPLTTGETPELSDVRLREVGWTSLFRVNIRTVASARHVSNTVRKYGTLTP